MMEHQIECCDNLQFLEGIEARTIDLIYIDPPFNTGRNFKEFNDSWNEPNLNDRRVVAEHALLEKYLYTLSELGNKKSKVNYLYHIGARVLNLHRILKNTGSIYVHIDPNTSHYIKLMMDIVFGDKNFRNEIVWCYTNGGYPKKDFPRKHDTILRYTKSNEYTFNQDDVRVPHSKNAINRHKYKVRGKIQTLNPKGKVVESWWSDITVASNIVSTRNIDYSTKKPEALLERIIRASSNEGDVVLDCYLGSGTTAKVAQDLNRKFIGCDINPNSIEVTLNRLKNE